MNDNLNQIAGENSTQVINEKGTITINNNSNITYTEIEKIFFNLFDANFPKLLEETQEKALKNIKEMLEILREKIEINKEKIDILKISSPNVQYNINNSIINVGKKGKQIDIDMLTNTLILFFEKESSTLYDLMLEEALNTIPRLTKQGILYLSMIYFYYYAQFNFLNVEEKFRDFEKVFNINFEINSTEILYLETLGCLSFEKIIIAGNRLKTKLEKEYEIDWMNNIYFNELNKKLEENKFNQLFLSPLGWLIAILNLKKYYIYLNVKAGF